MPNTARTRSEPFHWVWGYHDHRVEGVLTEPVVNQWRVSIRVRGWGSCEDVVTIPEVERGSFSTAHDALYSAEKCAIQYIDAIDSE